MLCDTREAPSRKLPQGSATGLPAPSAPRSARRSDAPRASLQECQGICSSPCLTAVPHWHGGLRKGSSLGPRAYEPQRHCQPLHYMDSWLSGTRDVLLALPGMLITGFSATSAATVMPSCRTGRSVGPRRHHRLLGTFLCTLPDRGVVFLLEALRAPSHGDQRSGQSSNPLEAAVTHLGRLGNDRGQQLLRGPVPALHLGLAPLSPSPTT